MNDKRIKYKWVKFLRIWNVNIRYYLYRVSVRLEFSSWDGSIGFFLVEVVYGFKKIIRYCYIYVLEIYYYNIDNIY